MNNLKDIDDPMSILECLGAVGESRRLLESKLEDRQRGGINLTVEEAENLLSAIYRVERLRRATDGALRRLTDEVMKSQVMRALVATSDSAHTAWDSFFNRGEGDQS